MSTWALIPIKGFDRGKSRLSEVLSPEERERLARELFEHVVRVLKDSPGIDEIAVVSDSEDARQHAASLGLLPLADAPGRPGLARVVDAALAELARRGATSAVVCMSDLPELTRGDIASVIRQLAEADVVLVPDRLGHGTNVIALSPPTILASCFGNEDSFMRHLESGRGKGLTVNVQLSSGIAFDLDHPKDLSRFRRR